MLFFNILTLFCSDYLGYYTKMSNFALVINLERHIEILLLCNDCVIVPGLGGFMAHHVDARYDERDNTFLPPTRMLGFNPKLNMNDSLLAQSYVEAYDISYPEAVNRIDAEVDELKQCLDRDGFFELENVGVVSLNEDGNCEFEPCESGILTPGLYGLAGVEVKYSVADSVKQDVVSATEEKYKHKSAACDDDLPTLTKDKPFGESKLAQHLACQTAEDKIITVKVSFVRNVLAVACALIAFFFLSTPINTEVYENGKVMSSVSNGLLYNLVPKGEVVQGERLDGALETVAKNKEVEKKSLRETPPQAYDNLDASDKKAMTVGEETETCYCIVLACRITRSNAEEFVARLQAKGYKDVRLIGKAGSSLKVVYGDFKTERDALDKLNALNGDDIFKESWIYHIK